MTVSTNIAIEAILSDWAGVDVVLREAVPTCWLAVPKQRVHIRSKVWQKLRFGPASGIGTTPIEAALLLARAIGAVVPKKVTPKDRARVWLNEMLLDGRPVEVKKIRALANGAELSWSSVDRAARDLCIKRIKCGFRSGWTWQMRRASEGKSSLR